MKPKNSLHLAGLLLILACVALLSPALSTEAQEVHALTNLRALIARITPHTEAQEVHALLIILGNDAGIRASVNKNEQPEDSAAARFTRVHRAPHRQEIGGRKYRHCCHTDTLKHRC